MSYKSLFEALGEVRKDWPAEKYPDALILGLQRLDDSFASYSLAPIESSIATEKKPFITMLYRQYDRRNIFFTPTPTTAINTIPRVATGMIK